MEFLDSKEKQKFFSELMLKVEGKGKSSYTAYLDGLCKKSGLD